MSWGLTEFVVAPKVICNQNRAVFSCFIFSPDHLHCGRSTVKHINSYVHYTESVSQLRSHPMAQYGRTTPM